MLFVLNGGRVQFLVRILLLLGFVQFLFGIGQLELRLRKLDFRDDLLLAGLKSRPLHFVARLEHSGFVFFFRQAGLRLGLPNLGLSGL